MPVLRVRSPRCVCHLQSIILRVACGQVMDRPDHIARLPGMMLSLRLRPGLCICEFLPGVRVSWCMNSIQSALANRMAPHARSALPRQTSPLACTHTARSWPVYCPERQRGRVSGSTVISSNPRCGRVTLHRGASINTNGNGSLLGSLTSHQTTSSPDKRVAGTALHTPL